MYNYFKTILKGVFTNNKDCMFKKTKIIEYYQKLFDVLKEDKDVVEILIQQQKREIELLNCKSFFNFFRNKFKLV